MKKIVKFEFSIYAINYTRGRTWSCYLMDFSASLSATSLPLLDEKLKACRSPSK